MKILKRVEWSYKFNCNMCSSMLEAEGTDVMYSSWEEGAEYYANCPVCGDKHVIKESALPHQVAMAAVRYGKPEVEQQHG